MKSITTLLEEKNNESLKPFVKEHLPEAIGKIASDLLKASGNDGKKAMSLLKRSADNKLQDQLFQALGKDLDKKSWSKLSDTLNEEFSEMHPGHDAEKSFEDLYQSVKGILNVVSLFD